jgi:superfamily II DNA/RNA helicase
MVMICDAFNVLNCSCFLSRVLYRFMTEVQAQAIPEVLKGNDVFVKAKTGTGKTLGFLIPAIEVCITECDCSAYL